MPPPPPAISCRERTGTLPFWVGQASGQSSINQLQGEGRGGKSKGRTGQRKQKTFSPPTEQKKSCSRNDPTAVYCTVLAQYGRWKKEFLLQQPWLFPFLVGIFAMVEEKVVIEFLPCPQAFPFNLRERKRRE